MSGVGFHFETCLDRWGLFSKRSALIAGLILAAVMSLAAPGETVPVSVGLPGSGPIGDSQFPAVSADGRYVVFESDSPDFIVGDTNGLKDIFLTDLGTGSTTRVSVSTSGAQGDGESSNPAISSDGRYVVFESGAKNLVSGDTNGSADIFVRDLVSGTTTRVSVDSSGGQGNGASRTPSISADGTRVTFQSSASNLVGSDTNGLSDIFVRDLGTSQTSRASVGVANVQSDGSSLNPEISGNGRYVVFESQATNLVAGGTSGITEIYLRDLSTGTTIRVALDSNEIPANGQSERPAISADGRFVAFDSIASNLATDDTNGVEDIFVRDLVLTTTTRVSVDSNDLQGDGFSARPSLSSDGRYVSFESQATNLVAGDTNGTWDTFVRDRTDRVTTRVSVSSSEVEALGGSFVTSISANGRYVVFESEANNLESGDFNGNQDIFVRDSVAGTTARISRDLAPALGNGSSGQAAMDLSGRYVVFASAASNLVSTDGNGADDVFLRDMESGTFSLVSKNSAGVQANGFSFDPSISADGRLVAFMSDARNLDPSDTTIWLDIFVRDLTAGTTTRINLGPGGVQANENSFAPSISADGRYVAFASLARNLVTGDSNNRQDIFLRDLTLNSTTRVSVSSTAAQANNDSENPALGDGKIVAFDSLASNLVSGDSNSRRDVFVRDLASGTTRRVSVSSTGAQGNGDSSAPKVSSDGRYVAFESLATNLVPGDTNGVADVFVRDLVANTTTRVSVSGSGTQGNGLSGAVSLSANGRWVSFVSLASNLVPGDTSNSFDAFVRDTLTGTTTLASVSTSGIQGNNSTFNPVLSGNGRFVAFESFANNLTSTPKLSYVYDLFQRDLEAPAGPVVAMLLFESWVGSALPSTADYILRTPGGTVVSSGPLTVAADGKISIPKPDAGTYELLVKSPSFLQKKVGLTQGSTTVDLGSITLLNGDVDDDNAVTVFDYIELSLAFDSSPGDSNWNPRADLDGDGSVTVFDYIILSQNFDVQGDE